MSSQEMLSGSSQGRHLCSHSFSRVEGSVCPTPATALDRELPACPRGAAPSGGPETSFNIEMGSSRKAKLHQAKEGCVKPQQFPEMPRRMACAGPRAAHHSTYPLLAYSAATSSGPEHRGLRRGSGPLQTQAGPTQSHLGPPETQLNEVGCSFLQEDI